MLPQERVVAVAAAAGGGGGVVGDRVVAVLRRGGASLAGSGDALAAPRRGLPAACHCVVVVVLAVVE